MAFKPRGINLDPTKLKDNRLQSEVQQEDNPLFQTISSIIDIEQQSKIDIADKISKKDKIDLVKQVSGLLSFRNGGVLTGLYTPNLTLVANLTGAGVDDLYYFRFGDLVGVFGIIQVNPTAIGVVTQLGISIPIPSYFFFDYHLAGVANCPTQSPENAGIYADIVNFRAQMEWIAGFAAAPSDFMVLFMYKVFQQ